MDPILVETYDQNEKANTHALSQARRVVSEACAGFELLLKENRRLRFENAELKIRLR